MDTYGLIGYPLGHSFSSRFFTRLFEREGIDAEYLNFEMEDIQQIRRLLLSNIHLRGLNVTIPYKERVIPFLNELSPEAEKIGAVNTIRIGRASGLRSPYSLTGYNTDSIAFKRTIAPLIRYGIHDKALILGTGGASKAVGHALDELGIGWKLVSRSPDHGSYTYRELDREALNQHQIIVNCTPAGMFPDTCTSPDIPYHLLTSQHLLYDLVYNPSQTLFLRKGMERGAATKNGSQMLEQQALAAWEIWNRP